MELQIVEFFKSLSCKFCDILFSLTNILGEDLFFYLIFFCLYWVYDRKFVFKYALVYFSSCVFNMGFKSIVARPRPIGATASGYSFPSGHSQSFSSVATGLLYESHKKQFPTKKWQRVELIVECIVFGLLVGIGRMYWGQHYLTDIIVGLIFGVIITVGLTFVIDCISQKTKISIDKILLIVLPFVVTGYILLVTLNFIHDTDTLAKIYRFIGFFLSVVVGYFVDKKWIKYSTDDTLKNKGIKVGVGSAVLMMFYSFTMRDVEVNALYPVFCFIIGLMGTVVLPWFFKTFKNNTK